MEEVIVLIILLYIMSIICICLYISLRRSEFRSDLSDALLKKERKSSEQYRNMYHSSVVSHSETMRCYKRLTRKHKELKEEYEKQNSQ